MIFLLMILVNNAFGRLRKCTGFQSSDEPQFAHAVTQLNFV